MRKDLIILFENILKESAEVQKAYSDGNEVLRRVSNSIEAINHTKEPLLTLVKWRIPISIILEAISEYCHSIILRESKTKITRTPNLQDISNAINYYNEKLENYSSNFNPKLIKFSDLATFDINRKGIIERLNYGILAARNCKDREERKNIIGVISDLIKPTNIYINNLNRVISIENERRQEKNIKPLDEIDPISKDELEELNYMGENAFEDEIPNETTIKAMEEEDLFSADSAEGMITDCLDGDESWKNSH